jgi:hypothetical protein
MRKRLAHGGATLALLTAIWATTPAAAHHSFAAFDTTRIVRIDGVVAEFQWTNPHAWLEVDVKNPQGAVDRWGIEFNSPNNLTREGWSRHMLNAGDHVSVLLNPMRDGQHGGLYYAVTFANGETKTVQMTPFAKTGEFDVSKAPSAYDAAPASPATQEKKP